ncbi:hypothetical protein [Sorangium cellulosum]|uniref:Uncharacterized protein n=1 Tax=Sorangium cellulosum TaxID=56 RepID=A0A150QX69_SORCE|nr:hypothetical protein [Sorangium cellulosum]KYF72600.1 hypothetical protein BE15_16460 [Sorangium cellulosum]
MRGALSAAEDDTPRDVLQRDDETQRARSEQLRRELAELRQAPKIAQTLVELGADLSSIVALVTLEGGIAHVLDR